MSKEQLEHFTVEKLSASSAIPLQSGQWTFICKFGYRKYNKVIQILATFGNRFINQDVPIYCMDSTLKPVLKRQLLVVGASLGAGLVFTYFFGFFIGLAVNIAVMVGIIFFIRRKQLGALRSFGFGNESAGYGSMKLKYVCLSCGAEVKGVRCGSCGSNMKKPLF
jgi:hypothetical protein